MNENKRNVKYVNNLEMIRFHVYFLLWWNVNIEIQEGHVNLLTFIYTPCKTNN